VCLELIADQLVLTKDEKHVLRRNIDVLKTTLRHLVEPNSGLIDNLFSKKILTHRHATEIASSLYNKNDKLLDFLLSRYDGDCSEVMEALVETGQLHVANFIKSVGGTCVRCFLQCCLSQHCFLCLASYTGHAFNTVSYLA
jgi:hypothetical protein